MRGHFHLWVLILVPAVSLPAQAGIFKKTARPEGTMRIPALLYTVRMDPSEKKRLTAAEELRDYDAQKSPEIIAVLVESLQQEKSAAVRAEVAQTLGKMRPVSPMAAQALEQASRHDPVMRVRMQAWTALRFYHLAGYRAGQGTKEPDIRIVNVHNPEPVAAEKTPLKIFPVLRKTQTPAATPVKNSLLDIPRAMPSNPGFSTALPVEPPRATPPAVSPFPADGPRLEPPR